MPLLLIALAATAGPAAGHSRTFLASITGIELRTDEGIDKFEIDTWGVDFRAVCHIPSDWEMTAGSFGPEGRLSGVAGHGASWLRAKDLKKLRALVLVQLVAPVQKGDVREGTGIIPATFSGFANVQSGLSDRSRKTRLRFANVELTPASACPGVR